MPGRSRQRVTPARLGLAASLVVGGVIWVAGGSDAGRAVGEAAPPPASPAAAAAATPPSAHTPAPSADLYVEPKDRGAEAYAAGDYARSAERYRAAIASHPEDAESLSNLGQVLIRLDRVPDAVPYLERAIAIDPDRWAFRFNHARALGLLGRRDEAVLEYREAQRLFPQDYVTAFNLGLALHAVGDDAGAADAYRKAIGLDPGDATFHKALGTSLERLQRPLEASAAYAEYLRLAPTAADAGQVRGRIERLSPAAAPGQRGS